MESVVTRDLTTSPFPAGADADADASAWCVFVWHHRQEQRAAHCDAREWMSVALRVHTRSQHSSRRAVMAHRLDMMWVSDLLFYAQMLWWAVYGQGALRLCRGVYLTCCWKRRDTDSCLFVFVCVFSYRTREPVCVCVRARASVWLKQICVTHVAVTCQEHNMQL